MNTSGAVHVLVVDDEPSFSEALSVGLAREGFRVSVAADGVAALEAVRADPPDLVLLDVMLPKLSGLDVCRTIRATSDVPIIMVTARSEELDAVVGLEVGADDYVTKPFGMDELLARLRAVLRRRAQEEPDGVIDAGRLRIDLRNDRVLLDGEPVHLTRIEWRIVAALALHEGRLVGQRELLQTVWGPQYETETHYLRVYMTQLRRKLEVDPARPQHILTEPGMGYRFVARP